MLSVWALAGGREGKGAWAAGPILRGGPGPNPKAGLGEPAQGLRPRVRRVWEGSGAPFPFYAHEGSGSHTVGWDHEPISLGPLTTQSSILKTWEEGGWAWEMAEESPH